MQIDGRTPRLPVVPHAVPAWHSLATIALVSLSLACGAARPAAGADNTLDEIVVTARKTPERLADVPISTQVLSGKFLDATAVSNLSELQYDVPGLVVTSAGLFGAGIALRGVTDQGGGSLAVAPHIDGVYMGRSGLAIARLFDVERIEVLKGPQGTLYGRNATGGSINIINRLPGDEFSAGVESALGSFDTLRLQAHVDLPTEKLALRLAAAGSAGDGFIRNTVDARRFAAEDYFGARATALYRPTESLTIDFSAQHIEDDGASGELWTPRRNFLPVPGDIRLATVHRQDAFLTTRNDAARLNLAWDAGAATLRAISGYAKNTTRNLDDCAGVPVLQGCIRGVLPMIYDQVSQELQLLAPETAAVAWLLGLYYLDAEEATRFHFSAPLLGPGPINDYAATADERAAAAYGQARMRVGERWQLTGGLRRSHERHRAADSGTGAADNPLPVVAEGNWGNTSWRFDLQYRPNRQTVAFASVATGFKSGGVTTERLPDGAFDDFEPEDLTAYEAGVKWRSPNGRGRLDASAFFYDIRNLQVRTTAILANRVTSVIDNAASARIHGVDLASAYAIGNDLTLSGALVWLPRRTFVDFTTASTAETLSGNTLIRAPEWTASASVQYTVPLRMAGEWSARLDYNYRSSFFFTGTNDPNEAQDAFGLLNLFLRFDPPGEQWYLFGSARNILDTDYFEQVFLQSSPGRPAHYEIGFGLRL